MMSEHLKPSRSPISGLKPFLLVGLLVVIGLLVGLGALLRPSDQMAGDLRTERIEEVGRAGDALEEELVPGAMTIGRPTDQPMERDQASSAADAATPAPSVTPSEFTFYETLKKPPRDLAATVGLTPPKPAPNPPKADASSVQSSKPAAKSASRVIETATAQSDTLRYTVQVGAFHQQPMAERLISELNRKGHHAYLMAAPVPDGMTYRVRVGKFATREEAAQAAKRLAAQEGLHPFIATIPPNS